MHKNAKRPSPLRAVQDEVVRKLVFALGAGINTLNGRYSRPPISHWIDSDGLEPVPIWPILTSTVGECEYQESGYWGWTIISTSGTVTMDLGDVRECEFVTTDKDAAPTATEIRGHDCGLELLYVQGPTTTQGP